MNLGLWSLYAVILGGGCILLSVTWNRQLQEETEKPHYFHVRNDFFFSLSFGFKLILLTKKNKLSKKKSHNV